MTTMTTETDAPPAEAPVVPVEFVPTRETVNERVVALLGQGRKLKDLTAPEVLGVSAARITTALNEGKAEPSVPRLGNNFVRHRTSKLNKKISAGTPLSVVGLGGRDFIQKALTPYVTSTRLEMVMEILRTPGHQETLEYVTKGITCVQFADTFSNTSVRYGNTNFAIARQEVVDTISKSDKWQVFMCPWDDRWPAFAIKNKEIGGDKAGVGQTILIFLNIFGTPEGKWVRTANGLDVRAEAFSELMAMAIPHLSGVYQHGVKDTSGPVIRDCHSHYQTILAFGSQALGRVQQELDQEKRNERQERERITKYQDKIIGAMNARRDAMEKIELLEAGGEGKIMAAITTAVTQMEHIRNLKAVKAISFVQKESKPALYIELYDISVPLDYEGQQRRDHSGRPIKDGDKILCRDVSFWLFLTEGARMPLLWDVAKARKLNQTVLHPNLYTGGDTCWGELSGILPRKLGERDWLASVNLITRMLQAVGWPFATPDHGCPATDLPAGYQYPGREIKTATKVKAAKK